MKIAYRDVTDETPLPVVDMIHYFMDKDYLMSVFGDAFCIQSSIPEWPNE